MALKVGELFASLNLDDRDFNKNVDRSGNRFGGLAAGVAKGGLIIAGALAGIATASGVMAAGFEKDMANVGTLLGRDGTARVAELGQSVKGLSMETGKPLDDLAGGLYQVVSAFGDTAESADILRTAARASTAGLATTTDAVNLLAGVTKGYGDTSAAAVQKASDLAFVTVKLGQTSFPELAANMGKVIPLAATLGVQQEELFGAMAALTGVTGNTAEVTTQLKAANQALINSNPIMIAQLKEIGYENGAAAVEALGFQGTLDALAGSVDGDTQALAQMFGSVEALGAVLALTGAQSDDFTNKTAAMADAVGATDEAFEIQAATVSMSFDRIMASAGVLAVNLGEKLLPAFQNVLNWVLDNWDDIAAVFDTVFAVIGDIVTGFVENVWPMLLDAFTFLVDEVVPAVAGAIEWFVDEVMPVLAEAFRIMTEDVLPAFGAALEVAIPLAIDATVMALSFLGDEVLPRVSGAIDLVRENWEHFGPFFKGIAITIAGVVAGVMTTAMVNWAIAAVTAATATIVALLPVLIPIAAIALAIGALAWVWAHFGDDISRIIGRIADNVRNGFGAIGRFFTGVWDGITGAFKNGINAVIGMINGFIRFFNNLKITVPKIDIPLIGPVGGFSIGMPNLPLIPRLAKGGRILGDGLALIGEEGPELMHMRVGATVAPLGAGTMPLFSGSGRVEVTLRDPDGVIRGAGLSQSQVERVLEASLETLTGELRHRALRMGAD